MEFIFNDLFPCVNMETMKQNSAKRRTWKDNFLSFRSDHA